MNKFLSPDDPMLIKIAEPVAVDQISSSETKQQIEQMLTVAYGNQGDRQRPVLVGLAAPQIGISKRIILVDVSADGKGDVGDLRIYINPEIIWSSPQQNEWYEGCYSTSKVCGIVSRPTKIKIKAYTLTGEIIQEDHTGYIARIFQHEIDHLNGLEFATRITDDNNLHWVEPEQFPEYRNNEGWRTWAHKCKREKWEKIKGITK